MSDTLLQADSQPATDGWSFHRDPAKETLALLAALQADEPVFLPHEARAIEDAVRARVQLLVESGP